MKGILSGEAGWQVVSELPGRERGEAGFCAFTGALPARDGPLLRQLQASGLGLTINKYYAGGYMHADDIRTLATSEETLTRQIALVKTLRKRTFTN